MRSVGNQRCRRRVVTDKRAALPSTGPIETEHHGARRGDLNQPRESLVQIDDQEHRAANGEGTDQKAPDDNRVRRREKAKTRKDHTEPEDHHDQK